MSKDVGMIKSEVAGIVRAERSFLSVLLWMKILILLTIYLSYLLFSILGKSSSKYGTDTKVALLM
jgi:hypothetical protein